MSPTRTADTSVFVGLATTGSSIFSLRSCASALTGPLSCAEACGPSAASACSQMPTAIPTAKNPPTLSHRHMLSIAHSFFV